MGGLIGTNCDSQLREKDSLLHSRMMLVHTRWLAMSSAHLNAKTGASCYDVGEI